jgi:hypothetical protein
MPMNQFLFDHQLAAMKVDRSGSAEERKIAFEAMGARAKRIAGWRKTNGLSNLGWPRDERPPHEAGLGLYRFHREACQSD